MRFPAFFIDGGDLYAERAGYRHMRRPVRKGRKTDENNRDDRRNELGEYGSLLSDHKRDGGKRAGWAPFCKILLYSVDFDEIEKYQAGGEWEKAGEVLSEAAVNLEKAGADYLVICTNTMHKVVPQIQTHIQIPIIHIAEATADVLKESRIRKVALLGTKYTMTQDFYKGKN